MERLSDFSISYSVYGWINESVEICQTAAEEWNIKINVFEPVILKNPENCVVV